MKLRYHLHYVLGGLTRTKCLGRGFTGQHYHELARDVTVSFRLITQ